MLKTFKYGFYLMVFVALSAIPLRAAEADPAACLGEIERVCVHLEDKLETCLSERGNQLSVACHDQLKSAMSLVQDPSGPALCMPDVQRLCPGLKAEELSHCIADQQTHFSVACQNYLRKGRTSE
jgi:hypothetical protein